MMQNMQQSQRFLLISSAMLDLPNVIHDHVANFFDAMVLRQQVLCERGGSDFGKMFVLSDREHFLLGQAAKPNAVFECNHVTRGYSYKACGVIDPQALIWINKSRATKSRALLKPHYQPAVLSPDHLRRFCENSLNDLFPSDNSAQEPSKSVRTSNDPPLAPPDQNQVLVGKYGQKPWRAIPRGTSRS